MTIDNRGESAQKRILIIHPEQQYFAGAEKMLHYFLDELVRRDCIAMVGTIRGSRVAESLPSGVVPIWLNPGNAFSVRTLWSQSTVLLNRHQADPFEIVHGWAARDWELASLVGKRCHCPAVGTLHDHPNASFLSRKRRRLMQLCARFGLGSIACVSAAVQSSCEDARYPSKKLTVVRNGLPKSTASPNARVPGSFRIGFLGAFSERKGLRDLFRIIQTVSVAFSDWELHLAGGAQDAASERLIEELRKLYAGSDWWSRVRWHGWVAEPQQYLQMLDILIVPSSEFDPFPTVLLEAGQAGVPVLAARVGGVPEIVVDGQTGWLFEPGDVQQAVALLKTAITAPLVLRQVGQRANARVRSDFSVSKMVSDYLHLYSVALDRT